MSIPIQLVVYSSYNYNLMVDINKWATLVVFLWDIENKFAHQAVSQTPCGSYAPLWEL